MRNAAFLILPAVCVCGQAPVSPEAAVLAKIRNRVASQMQRLPNFTCLQETTRTSREHTEKKFEKIDTVRLEVAVAGDKELFAWPGGRNFGDAQVHELVNSGAITSGLFGLFTRQLFQSNAATFDYRGEGNINGRPVFEYGFRVPQFLSGYTLLAGAAYGKAGYEGRFLADRETLDVVLLKLNAVDLPPDVQLESAHYTVEFNNVDALGNSAVPASAIAIVKHLSGKEYRNDTAFTNCREFQAESAILFEDVSSTVKPSVDEDDHSLPAGLLVEVKLQSAVDFGRNAVGDEVKGTVVATVSSDGEVLIPKGTLLNGHVFRLERESSDMYLMSIQFSEYILNGRSRRFGARLEGVDRRKRVVRDSGGGGAYGQRAPTVDSISEPLTEQERSTGTFYSSRSRLPRGFTMVWVTVQ